MLRKYCPWFRRTSKRRGNVSADMKNTPPPYVKAQNQDPVPLINPLPPTDPVLLLTDPITISRIAPHQDAIIGGATLACTLSSAAITARALAENPESAIAMANALQRIKTTVTTVLTARGIPSNSPTAATIWAAFLGSSIRKARDVADRLDEPDLASQEAARLEGLLASGGADAIAIQYCRRIGIAVAT
ncbi:hypothetical protein J7T55_010595 [Diaporthe amygdali]|uniref:uncharacterized protein n=1 Tax=Phomopsis amygdali TaxID=1214568 RepID=UPI0022FE1D64|nr:uncharacterized protein J7T55_010595 [Diaporthe amygdali]KAJ0115772.1 hypothetical protein J7T55_010595 [Diaporthe amygdali]